MLTRLLVAAYFIEVGLVLVIGPWTEWWDRNFFAAVLPWLPPVMAFTSVRLAVTTTGVVTMFAGLSDAWRILIHDLTAGEAAGNSHPSP
jgi:hypothetical protein